jgi:protoporphyrinogen oxidase
MRIAVIGGGFAGLAAAYDLLRGGHAVTVYEAAPQVGGLASGFKDAGWEWSLERFYHHIFQSDESIIGLTNEIGAGDLLFFKRPTTAFWCAEHGAHAFDGALPVLMYPHLPMLDKLRVGASVAALRVRRDWRRLERVTAESYLQRWMGRRAYLKLWEPLLVGKFGPYAAEVNAAWFWARIASRTPQLGYFRGGFQALANALAERVRTLGGTIQTAMPVQSLRPVDGQWELQAAAGAERFDRTIVASSPGLLAKIVPDLPSSYTAELRNLKSLGAIVLVVALRRQLLTNGMYWLNLPKGEFPYLALVEHTNMIDRRHYGGDHLVYLGDYLPADHRYFRMAPDEVAAEWIASLTRANPSFEPDWVRAHWLHREAYAQPVVPLNHSRNLPALQTPLPGLFFASMSQVYPWDRGTNYAVELGKRVAAAAQAGT